MRLPRASLSTLAVVVALAAVDLAVIRSVAGGGDWAWLRIVALPAANLLILAAHRDRRPGRHAEALAVGVLLVAADLAVLRSVTVNDEQVWLRAFALPMANVLVLADHRDRHLRRRGERSPFLLGFQLAGWAALLAYLGGSQAAPGALSAALASAFRWVHTRTLDNLDFETMRGLDPTFGLAWRIATVAMACAASAVLTLAMLAVATCVGLLARWMRTIHEPREACEASP